MVFMQDRGIAHCCQGAFVQGHRGTDHILVLNTLIDIAKNTSQLYAAMLDLSKAYDTVNREILAGKLIDYGLGPKFCCILEDMYSEASSCIKLNNKIGLAFTTNVGLKQGDPLPPLLFNLFFCRYYFLF